MIDNRKELKQLLRDWEAKLSDLRRYHDDDDDVYEVENFNIEVINSEKMSMFGEASDYVEAKEIGQQLEFWKQDFLHELFIKWIEEG